MMEFVDFAMRSRIDGCLEKVALILDKSRLGVSSPEQVAHQYEDKYLLANHLVNATIACYTNCFEQLGLSQSALATLKQWAENRNVSLCFVKTTTCNFLKEAEIDVQNPTSVHVDGTFGKTIVSVVTKVKEYTYSYKETFTFGAFSGVGDDSTQQLVFYERNSQIVIVTRTAQAPFSESTSVRPDVNITWLLNHLNSSTFAAAFEIDRLDVNCCTPLQNPDVFSALKFASAVGDFCSLFAKHLTSSYDIQARHGARHACKADINSVNAHGVFNPIVPLFRNPDHLTEEGEGNEASTEQLCLKPATACLQTPEVNQLLHEHRRSLAARCDQMDTLFSASATSGGSTNASARGTQSAAALFTAEEARRIVVLQNVQELSQSLNGSLDFIEQMIRAQLVAAVGKELAVKDFAQYMTFHNRKVFKEEHQPKPFSYAVRRSPAHSPEGQIQIETAAVIPAEPIYTVSQSLDNAAYMEFALNATTTVKFGGERHLHGWMAHRFSGQALPELKLIAQARQFSSYIVLIGRIASAKLFQPKYGFIVQNKDEISIPLELEHIPTAREFKDAISSLSPEQQRFAKAFRSMQLESTLFGVCVIQIKPQLEKVLKLQADSLTKEIKLTQDLMQLFTKYQISPDLLTYDEALSTTATTAAQSAGNCRAEASATEKLLAVKKHVQALQEMLMCTKEVLVADRNQQREYRGLGAPCGSGGGFTSFYSSNGLGEINRTPVAPSGFGFGAAPAPDRSAFGTTQPAGSFGGFGAAPQPAGNFGAPTNFGGFGAAPQPAGNFGAPTNFGGFGATTATAVATSSSNFGAAHAYTGGFGGFCAAPSTISSASAHASYGAFQSQQQPSQQQKAAPTPASVVETSNVSARADHSVSHASASQSQETERIPQQVHRAAYDTAPVSLGDAGEEEEQQVDYTKYPDLLEGMYTKYDPETSLRPTIINPGSSWTKRSQESLMAAHTSKTLGADQQAQGKNAAFDLLDALTRSGALPVEYASLHVIIAATHCFDQSLMDTVVKRNVNPIERVERSTLIMAAALNNLPPGLLINENHVERVTTFSPQLFDPCLLAN